MGSVVERGRRAGLALLSVIAAVGLTACAATEPTVDTPSTQPASPASPSPSGSPSASPSPSPSPSPVVPVKDPDAKLRVSPIDFDGNTLVVAQFAAREAGATVTLQRKSGKKWTELATAEQDAKGRAEFLVPAGDGDYRAISVGEDAWVTPAAAADDQWTKVLSSEFNGTSLPKPWDFADTGSYRTGGRQCSAAYPSNVKLAEGNLVLSLTEEKKAANKTAAKKAGCKHDRYFRNATVSTGKAGVTMRTGTVAARIKFPEQQGMHGSVFLLSPDLVSEIDIIEAYGFGAGITNVVHRGGKRYPADANDTYVHAEVVSDREWWDDYHVFSVEWTTKEVVFRVDGVETRRIKPSSLKDDYFVYLSLLASDWEQRRFENPVRNAEGVTPSELPARMYVDWVRAWEKA